MEYKDGKRLELIQYVDIIDGKGYNKVMKKYEEVISKRFEAFDVSSKEKAIESFKKLWRSENAFEIHVKEE